MNSSRIMNFFAKGDKDWSGIPYAQQEKILSSFKEPGNDFERSFFQYKCQQPFRSKYKTGLLNFASLLVLPFLITFLWVSRFFKGKRGRLEAIGSMAECKNVVPDSLWQEYEIDFDHWLNGFSLALKDIIMLGKVIVRTPLAPYYILKITLKMAGYSEMIYRYQPKAFIVHDEYSFTSSLMTWYSNQFGVEQIDVMHGEKLYYMGDGFFHYNRCYVWDIHYKQLFIKLRAYKDQFVVEKPKAIRMVLPSRNEAQYAKYKYYLQIYNEDEIRSIVNSLRFAENENEKVVYRPHPLFSDIALLKKYVSSDLIENPREVSLEQSLANTDVVIGYFSTVLYQAYLVGKDVMLDDVTFRNGYTKLKEHDFIMSNYKNVGVLSERQTS